MGMGPGSLLCLPSPFLAQRKGHGCVQINGALMGRQARARLPCRMPRRVTHGGGASDPPRVGGAESSVPAGPPSPYRKSGRSPRPVLPTPASVVSSGALGIQGRTLPGVEAGVLGLSRARAATRAKVAPGGTPGSAPLQAGRDHPAWRLPEPIHRAPSHPQLQIRGPPFCKDESVVD